MNGYTKGALRGPDWGGGTEACPPLPEAVDDAPPGAADRMARLIDTIETQIIPRLMLAHGDEAAAGAAGTAPRPGADEVRELVRLALARDAAAAGDYVAALSERGTPVAQLYLELLAPAARHLGDLWVSDQCSFAEVTLGLCRLHQVLRDLSPAFRERTRHYANGHRALLLPAPGEQHMFGVVMVAEFFRRAGWDVRSGPAETPQALARIVRDEWFAVVGLSVSGDRMLPGLPGEITRVRETSCNRDVRVLVGGRVFTEHPGLAAEVGADATARDAREATLQAESLLAMMA